MKMRKRYPAAMPGATAIEYGLIAALIAVVIIGALIALGSSLGNKFETTAQPVMGHGSGSLSSTDTPTSEPTPTPTAIPSATPTATETPLAAVCGDGYCSGFETYDTCPADCDPPGATYETIPVWYCTYQGSGVFEWYEVQITYDADHNPVRETTLSGPYTGAWQPNCPPGEPQDTGGSSGGGGSSSGGGSQCACEEVCVKWNLAAACVEYGHRDCHGNVCTP
jgi:pilus assembly protein Flp/PilA